MRNTMSYQIELVLIRHGCTLGNEKKRYIGVTEEGLSEKGISQLKRMEYQSPCLLFCSPRIRCIQSAGILFPEMRPQVIEELTEIDFGSFEGKSYRELSENPEYRAWIESGGTIAFPNGEGREAFCARTMRGMEQLLQESYQYLKSNDPHHRKKALVAAVVHGGTIMAFLSQAYGGDYFSYQVSNGEGYVIKIVLTDKTYQVTEVERKVVCDE